MSNKLIRLSKSCISDTEKNAVLSVLNEEYLGMGKHVQEFEIALSEYLDNKVSCVNTGTSAVQLALEAVGCGNGKEVLVPSLTYLATYQAISATGAKPISCDIDSSGLLCLDDCKTKLTENTVAIVPVFYAGVTNNHDEYLKFAKLNNLECVFDAAHAFGSFFNKKIIGSGEGTYCFSFDGIKNITCGEGGCVSSSNQNIIDKVNTSRQLGITGEHLAKYSGNRLWIFDVTSQGWRYHMSNINAAIGNAQLKRFDDLKNARQNIARLYDESLKNNNNIICFDNNYDDVVPHIYVVRIPNLDKREQLREDLLASGIETGVHYFPNHLLSLYKINNEHLPRTEKLFKEILTLPIHPDVSEIDVARVSDVLKNLVKEKKYY
jgi:dTDP-4-amino-4,6-dideoxygalactose transaminase